MKAITTDCILTSLRSRSDGSLGLSFSTPELTAENKVVFFQIQNRNCRMLLEPEDADEAPVEVVNKIDNKTQSQRLRGVLFRIWEAQGKNGEFQSYYYSRLERLIEKAKDELSALES